MRMSHIYQPLMLMELLGRRSPAPAQDIARRILGNGWWAACSPATLDGFREQRGEEVFAHRSRHRSPISGSVKYRVLTRARGRCECCGAHEHQRALEVDHIIPRNQGGSDDISNLQALCFRCNAGKRDTDRTEFRGVQASYGQWQEGCVFCTLEGSGQVLLENELALCIADPYRVSEGQSLVIPRRHVADGMALHQPEWNGVVELLKQRQEELNATIRDQNAGMNSSEAAAQTNLANKHKDQRSSIGECCSSRHFQCKAIKNSNKV
jgi:hypothetical protein